MSDESEHNSAESQSPPIPLPNPVFVVPSLEHVRSTALLLVDPPVLDPVEPVVEDE